MLSGILVGNWWVVKRPAETFPRFGQWLDCPGVDVCFKRQSFIDFIFDPVCMFYECILFAMSEL